MKLYPKHISFAPVFLCLLLPGLLGAPLRSEPETESSKKNSIENKQNGTDLSEINKSWMAEIRGAAKKKGAPETSENTKESSPLSKPQPSAEVSHKEADTETRLRNTGEQRQGLFPKEEGPSFFSVLLRFIGLMALFVGGFYFFSRYVRRKGNGIFLGGQSDLVEVVLSVPLVQGKFLQIVDVAGQLMILGVSEAGVQLLSEIKDSLVADKIRLWQSQRKAAPPPAGLLDSLTRTLKKADFAFWPVSDPHSGNTPPPSLDFGEILDKEAPGFQAAFADTKNNGAPSPPSASPTDEVEEISAMLQEHQRRLKSRKKKKRSS